MGEDIELAEFVKKILNLYMMLPKRNDLLFKLKFGLFLIYFNVVTMGMLGHLLYCFYNDQFTYMNIADDMAGIMSSISACFMIIVFLKNQKKIIVVVDKLSDFAEYEMPKDIAAANRRMNLMSIYIFVWIQGSMTLVWLLNLIVSCPETGEMSDCGLLISSYLPINIYTTPSRQIFMTFQVSSAFNTATAAIFSNMILLTITHLLINRIKHLKLMLTEIPVLKTREDRRKHIKSCVMYHHKIIEIWLEFNASSKNVFLCHISLTPVIMSMIAYQLLNKFEYVSLCNLIAWNIASLSTCVFGEHLITESESLAFCAYENIPFDGDNRTAKDLSLIMMRSVYPMYISGGDFGICRHVTYMAIIKTMYSYLTLLSRTN